MCKWATLDNFEFDFFFVSSQDFNLCHIAAFTSRKTRPKNVQSGLYLPHVDGKLGEVSGASQRNRRAAFSGLFEKMTEFSLSCELFL